MPLRRVKFIFETELIKRPVIYELGNKFEVVTNIRRAEVDQNQGWVILELEGPLDQIDNGLQWVNSQGVDVEPISGDILTG